MIGHKGPLGMVYLGEDRKQAISKHQVERCQKIVEVMNKRIAKLMEAYTSMI